MVLEQYLPNDYIRALVLGLTFFIIVRTFVLIIEKIAVRLTSSTKTDIDDIILKKASGPISFIVLAITLDLALGELQLASNIATIADQVIISSIIILVGYLIYVFIDIAAIRALKNFAKKSKTKYDDNLASLIHTALKITIIALTFLYILSYWGVQIGPLLAGLGIAGLAVALALQPTLSNIFSGISMILDKTLNVGDLVYLENNTKGKVERVGIRSTRIRTFDNELIIVPNTKLAESQIQNVTLPEPKSRAVVPFSVAYGSDIDKVKKIVIREVKKVEGYCKEPAEAMVRFIEMADSSLNFKAYFYVESFDDRWTAIDQANTNIYNALNKEGIEIPFPQMDVHLKDSKKKKK